MGDGQTRTSRWRPMEEVLNEDEYREMRRPRPDTTTGVGYSRMVRARRRQEAERATAEARANRPPAR